MSHDRNSTDGLPHWDLRTVYPDFESDSWERAVAELTVRLNSLESHLNDYPPQPRSSGTVPTTRLAAYIDGYLERMNLARRQYDTLYGYAYCRVSANSYDAVALRARSQIEHLGAQLKYHEAQFATWLGDHADRLPDVLARAGPAAEHAFYLQEKAQQSRYLMSPAEEALAAELALSGITAWRKLQGTICSQLKVPFERDGRREALPVAALQNLYSDPNGDVRRRAYEAELTAWESVREPLAAALNGVKGATATLNRRRGRDAALHAALDDSRIDSAILEAMLEAIQGSFPVFRRYLQAKAIRLGQVALPWWDLFAPLGNLERRFTFTEAQDFIVSHFSKFSADLAALAQRAFGGHWIDAEPRDGKRGGGFCMPLPGVEESRILVNYDGSLDQVFTVAHELGHAFHNECHRGRTSLQRMTPMTLAETASIFCETLITDAALAEANSQAEQLAVLEAFLIGATQVVVDVTSRYMFETEVFARREQGELSADDFCEIMLRAQRQTYGEGLDHQHLHQYMWAWKPHYYRDDLSFYNYPYAFGLLFGLGLYGIYEERGSAFVPEYRDLLASTGEGTPAELAARFGIDLRRRHFWESSLQVVESRIDQYLRL